MRDMSRLKECYMANPGSLVESGHMKSYFSNRKRCSKCGHVIYYHGVDLVKENRYRVFCIAKKCKCVILINENSK